jgi:predicted kinase
MKEKQELNYINSFAHMKAEWAIWFKCYGKLVVLNGVSSSGKTTLSKAIEASYHYKRVSMDDIMSKIFIEKIMQQLPEELQSLSHKDIMNVFFRCKFAGTSLEVQKLAAYLEVTQMQLPFPKIERVWKQVYEEMMPSILSGANVVIDLVIYDNEGIQLLRSCLNYYPFTHMLCYVPLEMNLERCAGRNQKALVNSELDIRFPGGIISQYLEFYRITKQKTGADVHLLEKRLPQKELEELIKEEHELFRKVYVDPPTEAYNEIIDAITLLKSVVARSIDGDENYHIIPQITADFLIINSDSSKNFTQLPCINFEDNEVTSLGQIL